MTEMMTATCPICGATYETTAFWRTRARTCGAPACRAVAFGGAKNGFYGKTHSEETRAKIRAAHQSPLVRHPCACGCGEWITKPAWKTRWSRRLFVNRAHMDRFNVGANNPSWRGGGKRSYGLGWASAARAARARDVVCQGCGRTRNEEGQALAVHHKVPYRVSQDNGLENLTTLCSRCHMKATAREEIDYPIPHVLYPRPCLQCRALFLPATDRAKLCSEGCRQARQQWHSRKGYEKQIADGRRVRTGRSIAGANHYAYGNPEKSPAAVATWPMVRAIRRRAQEEAGSRHALCLRLASEFPLSASGIRKIVDGVTWRM